MIYLRWVKIGGVIKMFFDNPLHVVHGGLNSVQSLVDVYCGGVQYVGSTLDGFLRNQFVRII